jgi:hypothetical protein
VRQQLLDAIYAGQYFRSVLHDYGPTSNQVWDWPRPTPYGSAALEAALTTTRRNDLQHGTTGAYVRGYVSSECQEHQRHRMANGMRAAI